MDNKFKIIYGRFGLVSRFAGVILILLFHTSCKKFITVEPPITSINEGNIYASDVTAASVLTGIYSKMSNNSIIANGSVLSLSVIPALSADELSLYSSVTNTTYLSTYRNSLSETVVVDFWGVFYSIIYSCNSAVEGLTSSGTLSPVVKQRLLGEAKFLRAFSFFYLVNLYGDVPLPLTTNWEENALLSRASKEEVYNQIIQDLDDARQSLADIYLSGDIRSETADRSRPNKWSATALLARVYLYKGDFPNAEKMATNLIENVAMYKLVELNDVFKKGSAESIWQLQPTALGENTQEARMFIIPETGPNADRWPVFLSDTLLNSFEKGDLRKIDWVDSVMADNIAYFFPYKYKVEKLNEPVTEYSTMLRLAEQYLIRAEARVKNGNVPGAKADLNEIRRRAGLADINDSNPELLLGDILHERQVELFTECGHRWLDIKRAKKVDDIMNAITPRKGGVWKSSWQFYPVSVLELQRAQNLDQTQGY
ncbi:RagB/SusD family nutrient uptake outer membrane protein [Chitinophaga agrisoli]|uniref:RagB/SusD family nutrient uptake outer membrane protein n=1 Tax=Chitinophaga agrisoli TaxID=2607653 RepID=A0A5B2VMH1_9BACT|nr:RagB/SusD family nutrient uptake outer membrane protein [Chitinophaga agrisoli]KAA2239888.1 RagB/SusD family nutrient uptake outer membrane protein [Chitinophaga agrisoli]